MSDDPLLVAEGIVAGYVPGVNILNGCNLELAEGELVGIVGPNGAGKSTLVKAMFGLVDVRDGSVRLRGEDIAGLKAHSLVSRGIGYVPQNNNVFPSLTVEENLEMGTFLQPKRFNERFDVRRRDVPSTGRTARPASGLALGRRTPDAGHGASADDGPVGLVARRAVGRSLAAAAGRGLRPLSSDQRQAGVSIVMVEQNASRCLQICDRGYVLDQGRTPTPAPGESCSPIPRSSSSTSAHWSRPTPTRTSAGRPLLPARSGDTGCGEEPISPVPARSTFRRRG